MIDIRIFHNTPISNEYYPLSDIIVYRGNPTAEWNGSGEHIAISKELLDQPPDPDYIKVEGNTVTICQYTLKLVAYYDNHGVGTYVARRIAPPMDEAAPTSIDELEF